MSVAVVDLFPEAMMRSEEAVGKRIQLSNILVIVGYSLILYIEKIVFKNSEHHHSHSPKEDPKKASFAAVSLLIQENKDRNFSDPQLQSLIETSALDFIKELDKDKEKVEEEEHDLVSGIILAMALAVHNLLEGIAIGLQKDEAGFINLALAVLLHHFFAAFALGINIKDLPKSKNIPLMASFVLSEPIGIAVGIGMSSADLPILDAVFLSLCTGTFLYIACSEIIVEQFSDQQYKYEKYISYLVGCTLFCVLISIIRE